MTEPLVANVLPTILPLDWSRPFLIGEAPSMSLWCPSIFRKIKSANAHSGALLGSAWRRFGEPNGFSVEEFAVRTDRINVFDEWQGKKGKGDRFPMGEARQRAWAIRRTLGKRRCVIFLGQRVAAAFRMKFDPFKIRPDSMNFFRYATCPHPSGINRWWNEPGNARRAAEFFKRVLR